MHRVSPHRVSEVGWGGLPTLAAGGHQLAEDRNGSHAEQAAQPDEGDDLVGVVDRLPGARAERMTDGVVAFAGDGHQGPRGDGDGGGCKGETMCMILILLRGVIGAVIALFGYSHFQAKHNFITGSKKRFFLFFSLELILLAKVRSTGEKTHSPLPLPQPPP